MKRHPSAHQHQAKPNEITYGSNQKDSTSIHKEGKVL
jgi:hypothetical protein